MAVNLYAEQLAIIQRLKDAVPGIKKVVGAQYMAATREMTKDMPMIAVVPGSVDFDMHLDGSLAVSGVEYQIVLMLPWVADDAGTSVSLEGQASAMFAQIIQLLEQWRPGAGSSAQFTGIASPVFADGYAEFAMPIRYQLPAY
jgi:hypothetical protein